MSPSVAPQGASTARDLLMVSLSRFYATRENMERVLPYVQCTSGVSLRLLDWFVTNYAKKHTIILPRAGNGEGHVNVYLSYRAQLKAYSKQQFDPFRRRDRIMFCYDRDAAVASGGASGCVETTVGQLNFFRWMLELSVLDYVIAHAEEVERDMLASQRAPEERSGKGPDGADTTAPPGSPGPRGGAKGRPGPPGSPPALPTTSPQRRRRAELTEACLTTRVMTRVMGRRTLAFD